MAHSAFFSLPEHTKMVEAIKPQAGASITGDYVSLKNCSRCYVVVHVNQVHATPPAITIEKATDVTPTGSTAITVAVPIWANQDTSATDTLVAQTAAVAFTPSAAQKPKLIVFEIDPATLGAFDCITVITAASDGTNITSALYFLTDLDYKQATPPAAITD